MNQKTNFGPYILGMVAIVIAIASAVFGFSGSGVSSSPQAGSTGTPFPHGITIGLPASSPTNLANLAFGACSLIMGNYTVAASTTIAADCAIAGVLPTDGAFAQLATSSQIGLGGWSIRGASASSTAGFITVSLVNGTGASNTIPASLASTTKYIVLRAQ